MTARTAASKLCSHCCHSNWR